MMRSLVLFSLALLLAGCGRTSPSGEAVTTKPQADGGAAKPEVTAACSLRFDSEGLCGSLEWKVGPSAEKVSSFNLSFWNREAGRAAGLIDPKAEVSSFLRMTCCGTVTANQIKRVSAGSFEISEVRFMPGEWEVYVQLKNGGTIEKKFIPVTLE